MLVLISVELVLKPTTVPVSSRPSAALHVARQCAQVLNQPFAWRPSPHHRAYAPDQTLPTTTTADESPLVPLFKPKAAPQQAPVMVVEPSMVQTPEDTVQTTGQFPDTAIIAVPRDLPDC